MNGLPDIALGSSVYSGNGTAHLQVRRLEELSIRVLEILNETPGSDSTIKLILDAIQEAAGVQAVAVRLRQGQDFPYAQSSGFSEAFLKSEKSVLPECSSDENCEGCNTNLECTCGMVLSGRFDPTLSIFSPKGSAWINQAQTILDAPADQDPRVRPRNTCFKNGFESVALIPIRVHGEIVGLLQLNDRRPGIFTAESIRLLEAIASGLGIAVMRAREEETLRTSEHRLHLVIDHLPDSYLYQYTRDEAGKLSFTFVTAGAERIHGLTPTEIMRNPSSLLAQIEPTQAAAYSTAHEESARTLTDFHLEFEIKQPSGALRLIDARSRPQRNADGQIQWNGFAVDVTERKAHDLALRESLRLRRDAEKIGKIGAWKTDLKDGTIECTEGVYEILESPVEFRPLLNEALDFFDKNSVPALRAALSRAANVGTPFLMEIGLTTMKRKHRWTEVRGLGRIDEGKRAFVTGTIQDITKRRAAENSLRESEERFRSVVEGSSIGVFIAIDLKFTYLNPAALRLLGAESARQLVGQPVLSRVHPDYHDTIRERAKSLENAANSSAPSIEEVYVRLDGSTVFVEVCATALVYHGQKGAVVFLQNITERKRSEKALRSSELLQRTILDNIPDPAWMKDRNGRFVAVNQAWCSFMGIPLDKALGESDFNLFPPEVVPKLREQDRNVMNGMRPIQIEDTLRGAGGQTQVFATFKAPVQDASNKVIGTIGIARDITENKKAAEALRQSEDRYRNLVETTFDWIWEIDTSGRYLYASPKIKDLLGYSPDETVGKRLFDLSPVEEAKKLSVVFRQLVEKQCGFSAQEKITRHKDGHLVILESAGVPFFGANGKLAGFRGIDRDISERKRLEDRLRQAQKLEAIGQLAGGVAHDFNNILAAIMMHVGLLHLNPRLDKDTRQALQELEGAARRAASLTRQLLMFSRRSVLSVKLIDLNDVVANLLKMLTRLIGEHIQLRFDGSTTLPQVEADAGMVEQVIMNLVVNARDAMPKGGRVTISTNMEEITAESALLNPDRQVGQFVKLTVADNGCGMDEVTLKRIYEPFFTTKEVGKGTGLGLATVHGIVAQHKGWIEVETVVGQGTTFIAYLPAVERLNKESTPAQDQTLLEGGQETILLVEDEINVRTLVARSLRKLGYTVLEAGNGREAVTLWQAFQSEVNVLLTDMVMPEGMTGLELAEQLRALSPKLKVIISSGYSSEIVSAGFPQNDNIVYLAKPYEIKQLAELLRKFFNRASAAPE